MPVPPTERRTESDVDRLFIDRWSPRAFDPDNAPSKADLRAIFEAARWAPSAFNEQPWTFFIAHRDDPEYGGFLDALVPFNQGWAKTAPILGFATCRTTHARNGNVNATAGFDTGAAWMALSLQANQLGYYTHGMGGFDRDLAHEVLHLPPEDHVIQCAFVIGKPGDLTAIPEDLHEEEKAPSGRKPLSEVFVRGGFKP